MPKFNRRTKGKKLPRSASKRLPSSRGVIASLQAQINQLRSMAGVGRQEKRRAQPAMTTTSPKATSSGGMAGMLLAQFRDPCNAQMVHFPDQFTGPLMLFRSVSSLAIILDGSGNKGVILRAGSKNSVQQSGLATYSIWTFSSDAQDGAEISINNYRALRCLGMCIRVNYLAATTAAVPEIRYFCVPNVLQSVRTASGVGYPAIMYKTHNSRDTLEVGWCPEKSDDFVPWTPAVDFSSGAVRIDGTSINNTPDIHLDIVGGLAGATVQVELVRVFEGQLQPATMIRSQMTPYQNQGAVDTALNATKQIPWSTSGEDVDKEVSKIAENAKKLLERPAVAAAVEIGKDVLPSLLAAIL
jgi:hypothetical protein